MRVRRSRIVPAVGVGAALLLGSVRAFAGGFEIPDNGTQAVGRGGAFVAKANDPTAIYHNPAGLARQRGSHFLLNGNVYLHSFEFQRSGAFPDDPQNAETPWGNGQYPLSKNTAGPFFAPFVAATTDFGYFDRFTLGVGVFGPPAVGNRTFPLGPEGKPASSRYDFVQSRSTIIFPTLSAGFRVTKWLDFGLSTHLVLGSFDQTSVTYTDISPEACPNVEYFRCDARSTLAANATSFGATLGVMARPTPSIALGATFRTPINIRATGTVTPQSPLALDQKLDPGPATLSLQLPWMARVGARYIELLGDFELYDLELNITYEGWGTAQKFGPIVDIPSLGAITDIQTTVLHGYSNTIGLRGGGAYNVDLGEGSVFTLRGGAYFDSAATDFGYTRIDFDTLTKIAGTLGAGYKVGAFQFDLGYAAVASVPRTVGSGAGLIRPSNGLQQGQTIGADGQDLPAVNEGAYKGFTHIISLGFSVAIDSFFGPPRPIHYGDAYEPHYVGEEGEGAIEKKPEEKRPVDDDEKRPEEKRPDERFDDRRPEEKRPEEKRPEEKRPEEKRPEERRPEEKRPEEKRPEEKKPEEKKPEEKKPEEKKPEEKPTTKKKPPPPEEPPPPPPEVKKPPPPPPPPPPPEKPPQKRKEWWEELE